MKKIMSIREKIKILFIALLMLVSAIFISAGDTILNSGELDISDNLIVNTDALYVDSTNSKVGIGTASPSANLHIKGSVPSLRLEDTGWQDWDLAATHSGSNGRLDIKRSGGATTIMSIVEVSGGGNIGIGTTSPAAKLHVSGGTIRLDNGQQIEFGGSTNAISGSSESNVITLNTNSAERMRIVSSGNVGIGTTSPAKNLHIKGGAGTGIRLEDTGWQDWDIVATHSSNAGRLDILRSGGATTIMSIVEVSGGGNIGIGTTDPDYELHVDTGTEGYIGIEYDTNKYGGIAFHENGVASGYIQLNDVPAIDGMEFFVGGGADADRKMVIQDNGNVGIGTTSPQYKLDVEGDIQAKAYHTGDIFFQKDNEKLWRMFEDKDALYVENLNTGKTYRFVLQEVK